jgi:hypothetical protein
MSQLHWQPGTVSLGACATASRYAVRAAAGATPSFLCRLVDDVVYWNTSRFSG